MDGLTEEPMTETAQQKEAYIAALIRERAGQNADIAAIDAELEKIGAEGKPPARRATKLTKKAKSGSAGSDKS